MPRLRRLLRLVEMLQSGRNYNSVQLAELNGVSRRTIFRDLNILQESGIHVHYDSARQSYSLPRTLNLPATELTLDETLSLLTLCNDLSHSETGIPFHNGARSACMKLLSSLGPRMQEHLGDLSERIAIRLDPRNPLDGAETQHDVLLNALSDRRCARIQYGSLFDGKVITTKVCPYRVAFLSRSWYVIGRSSLHRSVRTFNVGRIQHAELLEEEYTIPPRFSLEKYLGNAWRMIREPGRSQRVVIRFQPLVAQNVAEVQWHKTQKITRHDDGSIDFEVTVDGLREISWWILGYGAQAEVLQPQKLRDMVRDHAVQMCAIYEKKPARPRRKKK